RLAEQAVEQVLAGEAGSAGEQDVLGRQVHASSPLIGISLERIGRSRAELIANQRASLSLAASARSACWWRRRRHCSSTAGATQACGSEGSKPSASSRSATLALASSKARARSSVSLRASANRARPK